MAFDRPVAADEAHGGLIHGILTYFLGQTEHESESRRGGGGVGAEPCESASVGGVEGADTSPPPHPGGSPRRGDDRTTPSCHPASGSGSDSDFNSDFNREGNKENEALRNWPAVSLPGETGGRGPKRREASPKRAKKMPSPSHPQPQRAANDPGGTSPATQLVDDLAAVLGGASLSGDGGPATRAVSSSSGASSELLRPSGSATYSASTFASHQDHEGSGTHQAPLRRHPSGDSNASASSSRSAKKMSWSDEHQNRSLVEYFDESSAPQVPIHAPAAAPRQSRHWSAMRRNRRGDGAPQPQQPAGPPAAKRGKKRVLKGVLRRSGSYSPPGAAVHESRGPGLPSPPSTSESTSSTSESSMAGARSFRSISLVGSASSASSSSQSEGASSEGSPGDRRREGEGGEDARWVPSTLRGGVGAGGGIVMPRGGPMASASAGGGRYQVHLGAGLHAQHHQAGGARPPSQFLPHSNGYISPQYGFYVNITPPTPEMFAASPNRPKAGQGGGSSQSHRQLQGGGRGTAANVPRSVMPSPIPEWVESSGWDAAAPSQASSSSSSSAAPPPPLVQQGRFSGRSAVPRPGGRRRELGMLLGDSGPGQVWPTVPFG